MHWSTGFLKSKTAKNKSSKRVQSSAACRFLSFTGDAHGVIRTRPKPSFRLYEPYTGNINALASFLNTKGLDELHFIDVVNALANIKQRDAAKEDK